MTNTVNKPKDDVRERHIPMYKVLIHNDNVTPASFVVEILKVVFKKEIHHAYDIMVEAHNKGIALVVVEPLEHAEFHAEQVRSLAGTQGYPLIVTYEQE